MKRCIRIGLAWVALATVIGAAEGEFSRALRPEEFAAAGLTKLSEEERARLDALVRDFAQSTVNEMEARAVQAEASAQTARQQAEAAARAAEAEVAEQKKAEAGRFAKLKERLNPRTVIAIEPVESRIVGKFTGWEGRTVFALENGQRWQVTNSSSAYYTRPIMNPKVRIEPASLGGFWMTVMDVNQRVRISLLGSR